MKVGERIQVQIGGGANGVTWGNPNGSSLTIGSDVSINVAGVIIADLATHWQVRLKMSIDGKDVVSVPK